MAEKLDPLTNLPQEGKPKLQRATGTGTSKSQLSPMKDLLKPVDLSKAIPESAPTKMAQLASYKDFTVNPDYGKIMDQYNKNYELAKNNYLKDLDANQNWLESGASGVGKFLMKTVGGTGLGLLGTAWGAANSIFSFDEEGNAEFFNLNNLIEDNVFTRAEEDWKGWADELMPIYSDNPNYHNLGFMDKLMTEPGKLFGDEVGDALAFTFSAIGQEFLLSAATAATFGAAEPMQAAASVRLMKRGADIFKNLAKGKKYLKTADVASDVAKVSKSMKMASEAAQLSNNLKNFGASTIGLLTATHYEAAIEARGTKDAMMNQFMYEFEKSHGRKPNEMELKNAEDIANDAMWTTYGMNAAILSASNLIQFSSVFNKGYQGYKGAQKITNQVIKDGAQYTTKHAAKSKAGKFLTYAYLGAKNPVTEALEEFSQGVAHEGSLEYFGRQYSPEHHKNALGFFGTYGQAAQDYFNSKEGGNSMGIGAIVGLLGVKIPGVKGWSGGVIGEVSDYNKNLRQAEALVANLNSQGFNSALKENYKNSVVFSSIAEEKQEAAMRNDVFEFKNLEQDEVFSYMYNRISLGLKDDVIDDIEKLSDMPLEQFNKEFAGEAAKPFTQEEKDATIEKAIKLANSIEEHVQAAEHIIDYNLRNQPKAKADALRVNAEKIKPYLVHAASTLQNVDNREEALTERLQELTGLGVEFLNEMRMDSEFAPLRVELSKLINKKELSEAEKSRKSELTKALKINTADLTALKEEKKSLSNQDIKDLQGDVRPSDDLINIKDFVKTATNALEQVMTENPTKGIVNKGEINSIVEDIAKLRNRREEFSKFYEYLATEEGVNKMAKLFDAAEQSLGEEIQKENEAKVVEATEQASTPAQVELAKKKADEGLGQSQEKAQAVVNKKADTQSKIANNFDPSTPGTVKSSLAKRYKGNPELQRKEAEVVANIIKKYDPTRTFNDAFFTNPATIAGVLQKTFIPGRSDSNMIEEIKSYYSNLQRNIEQEKKINEYSNDTTPDEVPTDEIPESDFEKASDAFSISIDPLTVNTWQYVYDKIKKIFVREDGKLKKAIPLTTDKNTPDFDYINQGNLQPGDKIKLVVDTVETNPQLTDSQSFIHKFKILVVKETSEGDKVLGLLPAYKPKAHTGNTKGDNLLTTREMIYNSLVERGVIDNSLNYTTEATLDTGFSTTITNIDSGRLHVTNGLRQDVSDVLGKDFKLAIARRTEDGSLYLDAPNAGVVPVTPNQIKAGAVYALVKGANGKYKAAMLITRELHQEEKDLVPDVFKRAASAFNTTIQETKDLAEGHKEANNIFAELDDVVYTGDMSVLDAENPEAVKFKIEHPDGTTSELTMEDAIEIVQNRRAQVSLTKINTGNYNETIDGDKIKTNLVKGEPIHSATFTIGNLHKESEVTQVVETTPEETVEDPEVKKSVPVDETTDIAPKTKRKRPGSASYNPDEGFSRKKVSDSKVGKKWDKNKSLKWLKKNLPNVPVHIVDDLTNVVNTGGRTAWGVFKDAAIYISETAGQGTAYHEAFHAVFWLSLSPEERAALLQSAQVASGLTGDEVLEEYLAEKFEEYMISNVIDASLGTKIKNWFKRILATITGVHKNPRTLGELFDNINNGAYKNTKLTGKFADIVRLKMKDFTVNERIERTEMLSSMFINQLERFQSKYPDRTVSETINGAVFRFKDEEGNFIKAVTGPKAIFAKIYNEDLWFRYEALTHIADLGNDWAKIEASSAFKENPFLYKKYKGLSLEEVNMMAEQFDMVLDNFTEEGEPSKQSALIENALADLRRYGIKIDLRKVEVKKELKEQEEEYENVSQEAGHTYEAWQYSRAEQSGKDTVSFYIKNMLSKFIETKIKDDEITEVTDSLGYYKRMDFARVFNSLKTDLTGIYNVSEMMSKIESLVPMKPYYQQVLDEMNSNSRFKSAFLHALATSPINYLIARQDKGSYAIVGSNRNTPELTIRKEWNSSFELKKRQGELTQSKLVELTRKKEHIRQWLDRHTGNIPMEQAIEIAKYFHNLGINLMPEEIITQTPIIRQTFNKGINFILDAAKKDLNPFSLQEAGETSSILPLINIAALTRNDLYESSFLNVENKQVFTNQIPNFLQKMGSKLTGERSEEYINFLQQDNFFADNQWLNELKSNPKNKELFKIFMLDGLIQSGQDGVKYTDMSDKQRMLTDMIFYYNEQRNQEGEAGLFSFPILADAPQLPFIRFKKYSKAEIEDLLLAVVKQEYIRNQNIADDLARFKRGDLLQEDLIENYHIKKGKLVNPNKYHYVTTMGNWSPFEDEVKTREAIREMLKKEVDKMSLKAKRDYSITTKDISTSISNIDTFLENYIHNKVFANIQMLQLFAGDSSYYKSQGDLAKRNKQASNPGSVLDTSEIGETYNTLYLKDVVKSSDFIDVYEKVLESVPAKIKNGIISQYKTRKDGGTDGVSVTDAQGVISLKRYKDILTATGEWTDKHEEAYPKLVAGKATGQEMSLFMQPIKPFYYGMVKNKLFRKVVPVQNKNSEFVVFPQMLNMPYLNKDQRDRIQMILDIFEGDKVQSIQFDTTVKVGASKVYNFDEINSDNLEEVKEDTHTLFNKDYNIQLSVPEHHIDTTILFGTQIRKLVISNIDVTNPAKIYELNGQKLSGKELVDMYQEANVRNVEQSSNMLDEIFKNNENLASILEDEMRDRGMSKKYIDALELDADNNFKYPLYFPLSSGKNENVISALFRNRVTRQKIKGGSFVQVTDWVFGEGLGITTKEVELENGGKATVIDSMEALLPWWSKKYFPMDENGIVDIDKIPDELLELVGFRIPTEAKYSMPTIKVVGFTPQTAGGVAVLPADITRRVGADFDVDKLFIMMPEFVETPNGIQKVKSSLTNKKGRNNLMLDIMRSILQNPKHQVENITPGSFAKLQELKDEILTKLGLETEDLNMVLPTSQVELFSRNMAGKNLIGMFANHSANHAITQFSEVEFRHPITVILENGEERQIKGINRQYNFEGDLISESIAQFLAAAVDNAKDPVLSSLNINTHTADVVALLVRGGLSLTDAIYTINTPIVRHMIADIQNGTEYDMAVKKAKNLLMEKYGNKITNYDGLKTLNVKKLKGTVAGSGLVKENVTSEYAQELYNSILLFENLKRKADDLATLVSASRADSVGSQGITKNTMMEKKIREIQESTTFTPGSVKSLFDGTSYPMLKAFTEEGVMKANRTLNKYFPFQKGAFKVAKDLLRDIKGGELKESEDKLVNNHALTYIASKFDFFNISREESADMIYGFPSEFKERVENDEYLQNNKFIQALFFEDSSIKKDQLLDRIVTNNASRLEESQKEKIELGYEEMFNNPEYNKFAKDLLKYSFLVNGFSFSPTSFMNLLPISIFDSIQDENGKSLSKHFEENKLNFDTQEFLAKFIPNTYKTHNLVKTYEGQDILSRAESYYTTYGENNDLGDITSFIIKENHLSKNEEPAPGFVAVEYKGNIRLYTQESTDGELALYVLAPHTSDRGFYTQYTSDYGLDYAYFEHNLARLELFGGDTGFQKQGDIRYKGPEFLREMDTKFINDPSDIAKIKEKENSEKKSVEEVKKDIPTTVVEKNLPKDLEVKEKKPTFVKKRKTKKKTVGVLDMFEQREAIETLKEFEIKKAEYNSRVEHFDSSKEGIILDYVKGTKFSKENIENETGLTGNEDINKYWYTLDSKVTVESVAEEIIDNDLVPNADVTDVRNIIIDILSSLNPSQYKNNIIGEAPVLSERESDLIDRYGKLEQHQEERTTVITQIKETISELGEEEYEGLFEEGKELDDLSDDELGDIIEKLC